jgi:hypothetical protein
MKLNSIKEINQTEMNQVGGGLLKEAGAAVDNFLYEHSHEILEAAVGFVAGGFAIVTGVFGYKGYKRFFKAKTSAPINTIPVQVPVTAPKTT